MKDELNCSYNGEGVVYPMQSVANHLNLTVYRILLNIQNMFLHILSPFLRTFKIFRWYSGTFFALWNGDHTMSQVGSNVASALVTMRIRGKNPACSQDPLLSIVPTPCPYVRTGLSLCKYIKIEPRLLGKWWFIM